MTLAESTRAALAAAEAGDLDALAQALEARARAIAGGEPPTPEILAIGEETFRLLQAFLREVRLESARLKQLHDGFAAGYAPDPHIEYRG